VSESFVTPEDLPGTILDAHVHTVRGAADSSLQPDDLLEEARRIGLTGINISEHDRVWEKFDWQTFADQAAPIFLSRGMEVSTDVGHVIVFGVEQYVAGMRQGDRLREIADEMGAFITVAHPFRHFFDPVTFLRQGKEPFDMTPEEAAEKMRVFQVVHGIEVGNGGNTRRENEFAQRVARILDKPVTGGSDAHSTSGIATYTTVFPEKLESRQQTLDFLHSGETVVYEGLNIGQFRPFEPEEG
jgi:predicted metal-dependent phosphoesterase TrpH